MTPFIKTSLTSRDLAVGMDARSRLSPINELPGCPRFGLGGRASDT